MTILELIQICSVILGTFVGAPLIMSAHCKKRLIGFSFIAAGSILAMIVQFNSGLYYFFFASAFWLLNSTYAIAKQIKLMRPSYLFLSNISSKVENL